MKTKTKLYNGHRLTADEMELVSEAKASCGRAVPKLKLHVVSADLPISRIKKPFTVRMHGKTVERFSDWDVAADYAAKLVNDCVCELTSVSFRCFGGVYYGPDILRLSPVTQIVYVR